MLKHYKISKKELVPNLWDGGETFEYFIYPLHASYQERNFDFRISSATIQKTPSNFTKFSNYYRYLVMLDADLDIKRNGVLEFYYKHQIFKFNSNDEIVSFSLGNDFNLMVSDKLTQHEVKWIQNTYQTISRWIILFAIIPTQVILNGEIIHLDKNDSLIIQNENLKMVNLKVDFAVLLSHIN